MRSPALAFMLTVLPVLMPAGAWAQLPSRPYVNASGTLSVGGEVSATLSRRDDVAFFNYTDYDNDALRMARARLLGEWRPLARVSFLGEARASSSGGVELAAAFVRWQPLASVNLHVQAGRVPPVIGAFARRAYGRDNPLPGTPLAYQYLTSLRYDALPATVDDLLRMRARGWRPNYPIGSTEVEPGIPLVSASRWDTGIEAHWSGGWLDLAASLTQGSPADPVIRDNNSGRQWAGRAAIVTPAGLTVGASHARGAWLDRHVLDATTVAPGVSTTQRVSGLDAEYAAGRWLFRGEYLFVQFGLPVANAPAFVDPVEARAGFGEIRYRFWSRWQIAGRADRVTFSQIKGTLFGGALTGWDADVTRLEGALGLRLTRTLEIRGGYQYNWRDGGRTRELGMPTAQVLYWF